MRDPNPDPLAVMLSAQKLLADSGEAGTLEDYLLKFGVDGETAARLYRQLLDTGLALVQSDGLNNLDSLAGAAAMTFNVAQHLAHQDSLPAVYEKGNRLAREMLGGSAGTACPLCLAATLALASLQVALTACVIATQQRAAREGKDPS